MIKQKHPDDDQIVLVNAQNQVIGSADKLTAHRLGQQHRCISIQVFDQAGNWLLQQRADGKYHSPGLWSNTVCGHQRPNEDNETASHSRLQHEMGFDCDLYFLQNFSYQKHFPDIDITENEIDYLFIGFFQGVPAPNLIEVKDFWWISTRDLQNQINQKPADFTYWFREHIFPIILSNEALIKEWQLKISA